MPDANPSTRRDQVSISGDDSALPEEERAVLERARALIRAGAGGSGGAAAATETISESIGAGRPDEEISPG